MYTPTKRIHRSDCVSPWKKSGGNKISNKKCPNDHKPKLK